MSCLRQILFKSIFPLTPFCCLLFLIPLGGCSSPQRVAGPYQVRPERPRITSEALPAPGPSVTPSRKTVQPVRQISMPVSRQVEPEPEESFQDILMPVLTQANDRIFAYEEKMKQWQDLESHFSSMRLSVEQVDEINTCGWQLENILSKYNVFHERLLDKKSVQIVELVRGESFLEVERLDIDFLEGNCNTMLGGTQQSGSVPVAVNPATSLSEVEKLMTKATATKNHGQVIAAYEGLSEEQKELSSYEVTMMYGWALVKSKRQAEALDIFENLVKKYNPKRNFELMQLIADLQFAQGRYHDARMRYEQLGNVYTDLGDNVDWSSRQLNVLIGQGNEEIDSYAALLGGYLSYDALRDGFTVTMQAREFLETFPDSQVSSSINNILLSSETLAEAWFAAVMQKIDMLSFDEKFQEATLLIERLPYGILTEEKRDILSKKADELFAAEALLSEEKRLETARVLPEKWGLAMGSLEAKDYDAAIAVFKELLETEYRKKAEKQIAETVELAVREGRRRAAELFVRANKTPDPEVRAKLLVSSHKLLKEILNKYPESDLIDKVRRNLSRLEDELTMIDPNLILESPQDESALLRNGN